MHKSPPCDFPGFRGDFSVLENSGGQISGDVFDRSNKYGRKNPVYGRSGTTPATSCRTTLRHRASCFNEAAATNAAEVRSRPCRPQGGGPSCFNEAGATNAAEVPRSTDDEFISLFSFNEAAATNAAEVGN
jgi:hypothetical protein